jgi:hypothetical protein
VFTARYALSPYIKQMGFVFKGLITSFLSFNIFGVLAAGLQKPISVFYSFFKSV